jgi:uncharacterized membrane protein YhhN
VWEWGIAAALGLGTLHVVARYRGLRGVAGFLKPLPIAILATLAASEPVPVGPGYRWLIVAALVFSMAGDVWLLFPERFFGPGLTSFLVAHLLYIRAFLPGDGWGPSAWLVLVPFVLFGAAMLAYLWPHLARERAPVSVYVGVIAVMGWQAALRAAAPTTPAPSGALALAGALLFMASDGLLAVDRFARRFPAAEGAVMATYYAAQTLIALSVRA